MTKQQITVSYSELDTFRQCPFKHRLSYVERWSKSSATGMGALDKGTLWHLVLETHYQALQRNEPLHQAMGAVDILLCAAEEEGSPEELIKLMRWMYQGYVDHYGADPEWNIIAVEHTAIIPLFDGNDRKTHFRMKVKLDLVIEWPKDTGRLWIVDHKGHSNIPSQKDFAFEEQFGLYQQAQQRMGTKIFGLMYNAARTKQNKGDILSPGDDDWKSTMKTQTLEERHLRYKMNRSDPELRMIEAEALATCQTMYGPANKAERHVNSDTCGWRCDFTEPCLLGRRTGDNGRTRVMLHDVGFRQDFSRH